MGNWDLVSRVKVKPDDSHRMKSEDPSVSTEANNGTPKKTNFDTHFSGVSQQFQTFFNFGESNDGEGNDIQDVFDNALNGHYKAMMLKQNPKGGFLSDQFTKLGKSAWGMANYIKEADKKYNTTKWKSQAEMDAWADNFKLELKDLQGEFYNNWIGAKSSVEVNESGELRGDLQPVFFTSDARLQTPKQFNLQSTKKKLSKGEHTTNIKTGKNGTIFGWMTGQDLYNATSPLGAWEHSEMNDAMDRNHLRDELNPIMSEWSVQGFAGWDRGNTAIERYNNRMSTLALVDDTLAWIATNGTGRKGSKEAQTLARKMQAEMGQYTPAAGTDQKVIAKYQGMNKKLDYTGRKNYMLDHIAEWNEMTSSLGYYGSQHIYNKHIKNFGESRYYAGETEEEKKQNFSNSQNLVKKRLQLREEYAGTKTALAEQAYRRLDEDLGFEVSESGNIVTPTDNGDMDYMIYKHLLNDAGKLRSRQQALSAIASEWGRGSRGGYNPANNGWSKTQKVWVESESIGGKESGGGHYETSTFRNSYSQADMNAAFNRVSTKYKMSYGKMDIANVSKYTSLTTGLGYRRSDRLVYEMIDLETDNPKTDDVNRILSMVKDKDWGDASGNPVNDIYISSRDYQPTISRSTIKEHEATNWNQYDQRKYFRSFFNNPKKDKIFKLEFARESPLANKSFYTFTQRSPEGKILKNKDGTDKRLTMYIDRGLAQKYKETFVTDTFTNTSDWSFQVDGKWDMTYAQGTGRAQKATNLQIVNQGGVKYVSGSFWDANANNGEGEFMPKFLRIGSSDAVSIKDAEILVQDYLDNIQR